MYFFDDFYAKILRHVFSVVTDIRLIGGRGNYEGRIDVYYAGQWGSSICSVGFDDKDASVVCRSLGFTSGYIYEFCHRLRARFPFTFSSIAIELNLVLREYGFKRNDIICAS